jgi:hypothetical protein
LTFAEWCAGLAGFGGDEIMLRLKPWHWGVAIFAAGIGFGAWLVTQEDRVVSAVNEVGGPIGVPVAPQTSTNPPPSANETLTIDSSTTYQTFEGWEVSVETWHRPNNYDQIGDSYGVPASYNAAKLDTLVNDLGLTALRFELMIHMSGGREGLEPENDNTDPFVLNESKILWNYIDPYIREFVIPFKQRVESKGKKFYFVVSATAWSAWQFNNPEEYAEIYMAGLNRIRDKFNLLPDAIIIYNEPASSLGNESQQAVINGLIAVENRLRADPRYKNVKIRWPAVTNADIAIPWINALNNSAGQNVLSRVGQYDFHGYGQFPVSTLNQIRNRAAADNVNAVMGEWWFRDPQHNSSWSYMMNADDIITSLTEANATLYQGSSDVIVYVGSWPNFNPGVKKPKYYIFRQFYRFIDPGDVRIKVDSSDSRIKVVGFKKPDGRVTVVVRNTGAARSISLANLRAGSYGIAITSSSQNGAEQAPVTVGQDGNLIYSIPADSIVTFYGS